MTDTVEKIDKVVDELIVKHLRNLRDGYNNRMDQLMQMKEQLVLQSEQAAITGATSSRSRPRGTKFTRPCRTDRSKKRRNEHGGY